MTSCFSRTMYELLKEREDICIATLQFSLCTLFPFIRLSKVKILELNTRCESVTAPLSSYFTLVFIDFSKWEKMYVVIEPLRLLVVSIKMKVVIVHKVLYHVTSFQRQYPLRWLCLAKRKSVVSLVFWFLGVIRDDLFFLFF